MTPRFHRVLRKARVFSAFVFCLAILLYALNYSIGRHFPIRLSYVLGYTVWSFFHRMLPLAFLLIASAFLTSNMGKQTRVAVILVAAGGLLAITFWVPNPTLYWPSILHGSYTVPEIARESLTFSIVPPPDVPIFSSQSDVEALVHWQWVEESTRFWIVYIAWAICLIALWVIDHRSNPYEGIPSDTC